MLPKCLLRAGWTYWTRRPAEPRARDCPLARLKHGRALLAQARSKRMVATDSLCAPACVSDRTLVLILGGWSPGPLDALRWAMRDQEVDFLEPPLHMPPAGIRWCCTWEAVLLACCIWFVLVLVTGGGALPLVQRCALLLACMLALPAAVVLLVCG